MKVLIAGGGTGGHLFPGVAVAEEFIARHNAAVLFVGVEGDLEKRVLGGAGLPFVAIAAGGVMGKSLGEKLVALGRQFQGVAAAVEVIRGFAPDVVLGVGGYASVPGVIAAKMRGIPTAIAEQNSIPGMANRLLGKVVDRVFLSLAPSASYFPRRKVVLTGNPVRRGFLAAADNSRDSKDALRVNLLVCGGSQGARAINAAMPASAGLLMAAKDGVAIVHQCGKHGDAAAMQSAYDAVGVKARVIPFIDDMAAALREADIVVSRAGATTIAELLVAGKPAVLIPFPAAANDHQRHNARYLACHGAAVMMEEDELRDPASLAARLLEMINDGEKRRRIGMMAASLGKPHAAAAIVAECLRIMRR